MQQEKLKWNNLKDMKCPKCGAPLAHNIMAEGYNCSNRLGKNPCTFAITAERFRDVINSLYKPRNNEQYGDNQNLLNEEL